MSEMTGTAAAPTPVSAYALDHVGLNVPDLDAAVAFFTTWFDAEVEFRMDRFVDPSGGAPARLGAGAGASFALAMLRLGAGRLELLQWWDFEGQAMPTGIGRTDAVGAAHIGIVVDSVADALARLRGAPGVTVLSEPRTFAHGPTPGLTNGFATAPWGALLELVTWGAP